MFVYVWDRFAGDSNVKRFISLATALCSRRTISLHNCTTELYFVHHINCSAFCQMTSKYMCHIGYGGGMVNVQCELWKFSIANAKLFSPVGGEAQRFF